jgi:GDP-fucose protein O-fucosyltransferase
METISIKQTSSAQKASAVRSANVQTSHCSFFLVQILDIAAVEFRRYNRLVTVIINQTTMTGRVCGMNKGSATATGLLFLTVAVVFTTWTESSFFLGFSPKSTTFYTTFAPTRQTSLVINEAKSYNSSFSSPTSTSSSSSSRPALSSPSAVSPSSSRRPSAPLPSRSASSSSLPKAALAATTATAESNTPTERYLQYFAHSGWSNQVQCLKHAYYIARATNRTLILPPVMDHFVATYATVCNVTLEKQQYTFNLDYDLQKMFLGKVKAKDYIALHHVLDLQHTLPAVRTMDFREFYTEGALNGSSAISGSSSWVMETNFSHYDTEWLWNESALEGTQKVVRLQENGLQQEHTRTLRDLVQVTSNSHQNDRIWTLLDSYYVRLHQNFEQSLGDRFQPRFHSAIRRASRLIRKDQWKNIPYASIHVRGNDGSFSSAEKINYAIELAFKSTTKLMRTWAAVQIHNQTETDVDLPTTRVGLFMATDIPNIKQHEHFVLQYSQLAQTMQDTWNATINVLLGDDSPKEMVQDLKAKVGYPGIFLDQHLAACATIGFTGTPGSTFSGFIRELRRDGADACE